MSAPAESQPAAEAAEIAAWAQAPLQKMVGISSPSGDRQGAEAALALAVGLLPERTSFERPACSTPHCAPDLIATITGTGRRRLILLGHVDTVIAHADHQPLRDEDGRLFGSGTADMKGGVILALGVARMLARRPGRFAELSVLLVTDEEWRVTPFVHAGRGGPFSGYDACLCFEAGERAPDGGEGVVVRRKAAGTLRVLASGRASHSGSAPDAGRNALLALAEVARLGAAHHDPGGPEQLSAVPTVIRSGDAFNVVPAAGELIFDLRARRLKAFSEVVDAIPASLDEVGLDVRMEREWPGMDSRELTAPLIAAASARLGRTITGVPRGGASDASHFAATIPLTVDGLGPRGGGAHTPGEFVLRSSLRERSEVALALAEATLDAE
ncbi:MAG: M20/M25/M40 family metallo-hydrolase [Solirubrobacteraceae bacterium]